MFETLIISEKYKTIAISEKIMDLKNVQEFDNQSNLEKNYVLKKNNDHVFEKKLNWTNFLEFKKIAWFCKTITKLKERLQEFEKNHRFVEKKKFNGKINIKKFKKETTVQGRF